MFNDPGSLSLSRRPWRIRVFFHHVCPDLKILCLFSLGHLNSFLVTHIETEFLSNCSIFFLSPWQVSFSDSSHHQFTSQLLRRVESHHLKFEIFFISSSLRVQPYQLNSISFLRLVIFQTHCGDSRLFCFFLFHCNGLESPLHKCFMISHIF